MGNREAGIINLQRFVEGCGGLDAAAAKLCVLPSTLRTRLADGQVPQRIQSKFESNPAADEVRKKPTDEDQFNALILKIRTTVKDKLGVVRLADRMGVSPSSIEKILAGKPISLGLRKKLLAAAQGRPGQRKRATIERLKKAYRLYQEEKSLEGAGRKMGVSRERVRQTLAEGSQLGLYDYKRYRRPDVPKEKIIAQYKTCFSLSRVARINHTSVENLRKVLRGAGITTQHLRSIWVDRRKTRCIEAYQKLARRLGHCPSTAELQWSSARYLYSRIKKLWRSFDEFRDEIGVPRPSLLRRRVLLRRLRCIRTHLRRSGPMSTTKIAAACGFSTDTALECLTPLIAAGEIVKEGARRSTKYRLATQQKTGRRRSSAQ